MRTLTPDEMERVRAVRLKVAQLHDELPAHGLVSWTGGNISGRVPGLELFVIKPSGVRYPDLTADSMVV
ncbi:MAG TPA: L-ribulose-5-phosphate 4-epimerase, partial [Actinobacteria bacterium]|nr:L-ribulose-5-phosphate 4-epimerase [Actinomycetota bacterium]